MIFHKLLNNIEHKIEEQHNHDVEEDHCSDLQSNYTQVNIIIMHLYNFAAGVYITLYI